jgi:hypothetical protein
MTPSGGEAAFMVAGFVAPYDEELGEVPAKLEAAVRGVLGFRVEDFGMAIDEDMVRLVYAS